MSSGRKYSNKPPRPRRHYSASDRAAGLAALDAAGGNVLGTARRLGLPRKTLADWAAQHAPPASLGDLVRQLVEAVPADSGADPGSVSPRAVGLARAVLYLVRRRTAPGTAG